MIINARRMKILLFHMHGKKYPYICNFNVNKNKRRFFEFDFNMGFINCVSDYYWSNSANIF